MPRTYMCVPYVCVFRVPSPGQAPVLHTPSRAPLTHTRPLTLIYTCTSPTSYTIRLTLPYWNKYACAVGVVTGPGGHCHRTLGATLTGCGAKPDEKILATTATYKSDTCQCDACSGFSGGMVAAPYCHSRGLINTCHCMLVDNAIDNENACLSLE